MPDLDDDNCDGEELSTGGEEDEDGFVECGLDDDDDADDESESGDVEEVLGQDESDWSNYVYVF